MNFIKASSNKLKEFLYFSKKHILKKQYKNLYNSHKGEECYVFGDGVSIKYFDLSLFKDKVSIASNNFIFHKDFDKLNVKYYCIYEPYWFLPIFISGFKGIKIIFNKIQKIQKKFFKEKNNIFFFTDISNSIRLKGKNIIFLDKNFSKKYIPYNDRIDSFQGSLRVEISLAIFLGFKKIYLIGHDYTHNKSLSLHFYEKGKGIKNDLFDWNKNFLELAKKYIDIKTITVEGNSNTLESITYKELTGQTPIYKENNQIVEKKALQILSSWPYYNL